MKLTLILLILKIFLKNFVKTDKFLTLNSLLIKETFLLSQKISQNLIFIFGILFRNLLYHILTTNTYLFYPCVEIIIMPIYFYLHTKTGQEFNLMKTNGLFTLIEAVNPNKTLIILLILIQKNLLLFLEELLLEMVSLLKIINA